MQAGSTSAGKETVTCPTYTTQVTRTSCILYLLLYLHRSAHAYAHLSAPLTIYTLGQPGSAASIHTTNLAARSASDTQHPNHSPLPIQYRPQFPVLTRCHTIGTRTTIYHISLSASSITPPVDGDIEYRTEQHTIQTLCSTVLYHTDRIAHS